MSNQPIHVLSVLNLSERHLERIRAVSPRLVVEQRPLSPDQTYRASAQEFAGILTPEVEVLYAHTAPFNLDLVPDLRWVQINSAGVEELYDTPLWRSEVAITNASGIHAVQIAEYVLGMLLSYAHHFPEAARLQNSSRWPAIPEKLSLSTRELRGKTLGILGYGAIGREVARLASAFGMRILATLRSGHSPEFDGWTPPGTGDPGGSLPEHYYDLGALSALLPECDMLVLALPLNSQTHHLIGQAELALMRRHAFLVNIGRGPLIDHAALVAALQARSIGGAALDVTEPEPLPASSPLWTLDNAIITPHISGMSAYYNDRIVELFCASLQRYLVGQSPFNLVQRERGY
ncbi:MAG TPA: D-2-hydroxyacid dehydrogenase [Ktedonobacteraceae bacterium]